MYFQLVDNQVLSTQGQPDVFDLHRPTARLQLGFVGVALDVGVQVDI